jgi:hypothetical protein
MVTGIVIETQRRLESVTPDSFIDTAAPQSAWCHREVASRRAARRSLGAASLRFRFVSGYAPACTWRVANS